MTRTAKTRMADGIYPAIAGQVLKRESGVVTSLQLKSIGLIANPGLSDVPPLGAYPRTLDLRSSDEAGTAVVPTLAVRCILELDDDLLMVAGIQWTGPVFVTKEHQIFPPVGFADAMAIVPAGELLPDGSVRDRAALVGTLTLTDPAILAMLTEAK